MIRGRKMNRTHHKKGMSIRSVAGGMRGRKDRETSTGRGRRKGGRY